MASQTQTIMTHTRVALVTGAAQGIGRAIALRLASDGLDVAVDDIASKTELLVELVKDIENLGRKSTALTFDVSVENEVKLMVAQTVSELGRLDVMVANAGIGHADKNGIMGANMAEWTKTFAVNLYGPIFCYKYAAIQMVEQKSGGRIIGASSVCGLKGFENVGAYCISKASVRSLTQTVALELMQDGITVNCYAPGVIETAMTSKSGESSPCAQAKAVLKLPNAPIGQPEDVANAVSYLVSPGARFITGQTISVNGGILLH